MAEKGDHGQESRDAADRHQVAIELLPVPETFHEWFLTFVCVRPVLNLYPHVDQCTLAHDHDKGSDENDE